MSSREQDPSSKTEDPTQRKLDDAVRKGNVASSQEVNHLFMMAMITLVVAVFVPSMAVDVQSILLTFLQHPHEIPFDGRHLRHVMYDVVVDLLVILAAPVVLMVVAAVAGNMVQKPPIFTTEKLKWKLDQLSILKNLRKKFSLRQVVEFAKSLLKLAFVGSVVLWLIWPKADILTQLMTIDFAEVPRIIWQLALMLLGGVVISLLFLAAVDLAYQKWEHFKGMRMSRQELRDEQKESDGSPEVKRRLRQIRNERARTRMLAAVPEATVVVTNPTHYAVALKYDQETMGAPVVVAKGVDSLAMRIREAAEEHKVPIIENPPLARALHANAEIDREIPVEHYKAVAEVIGYIMRLRSRAAARRRPANTRGRRSGARPARR